MGMGNFVCGVFVCRGYHLMPVEGDLQGLGWVGGWVKGGCGNSAALPG
jgi:hypothetical protein